MGQQKNWAYSFEDVTCSITGPGGEFSLSDGGVANEGITLEFNDRITTTYGADGNWMHSVHVAKGGRILVRLLKNGRANALLDRQYNFDMSSSANTGQNTISVRNPTTGDAWVGIGCACLKKPNITYNVEGPMVEWVFNAGIIDGVYGTGTPSIV